MLTLGISMKIMLKASGATDIVLRHHTVRDPVGRSFSFHLRTYSEPRLLNP